MRNFASLKTAYGTFIAVRDKDDENKIVIGRETENPLELEKLAVVPKMDRLGLLKECRKIGAAEELAELLGEMKGVEFVSDKLRALADAIDAGALETSKQVAPPPPTPTPAKPEVKSKPENKKAPAKSEKKSGKRKSRSGFWVGSSR